MEERRIGYYSRIGLPLPQIRGDLLWEGEVHSVFKHSVNLKLSGGEGKLLTLFSGSENTFPGSLYVEDLHTGDYRAGDPVLIRENCLIAGKNRLVPSASVTTLDLSMKVPTVLRDIDLKELDDLKAYNLEERQRRLSGSETETMIYKMLDDRLSILLQSLLTQDKPAKEEITSSMKSMIGLGLGLTPSGDDMIIGVMAGCRALNHPAFSIMSEVLPSLSRGTTDVSRSYLLHASEGNFSEALLEAVETMCMETSHGDSHSGIEKRVVSTTKAIEKLLSFGHLSGSDTLHGLLSALTLIHYR